FKVVNTNDSGTGSLRQAVANATAAATADTVLFSSLFNTTQTITLTSGELDLTDAATTTISGPGAAPLSVSGHNPSPVFNVNAGASAAISGLTVTAGQVTGQGGGVSNSGTLTMTGSTISGSTATTKGGGLSIYSGGTATLTNCTVSANVVTGANGGAGGIQ